VQPEAPAWIFPFGQQYSRDRLGLAKWLTEPNHPLTSRVAVNRYWQMVFAMGLVKTTNDFGSQGALPSHPKLLDYLSRYFIDSGWDIRALMKHIVVSQTFRQDSNMTEALYHKDPENLLLARGPAYHMTAEMLRDNVMHAYNGLSLKLGGNSVRGGNRRSLYSFWERNNPTPELLIFGAPRRQVCSVKRESTSTPLQPLVLMNSPLFVNNARKLAETFYKKTWSDEKKLQEIFITLTSRDATDKEVVVLTELLKEQHVYFKNNPKVATLFLGNKNAKDDPIELAAWTVLTSAITNLDSFYFIR
jgi:hypothetical protein